MACRKSHDHEVYGPTPGCDGCVSLARGPGFQQVRHSAECRARIQEKEAEEVRKRKEEIEKQKKEDEEEQRARADKRVSDVAGGPSSSSSRRGLEAVAEDQAVGVEAGIRAKEGLCLHVACRSNPCLVMWAASKVDAVTTLLPPRIVL